MNSTLLATLCATLGVVAFLSTDSQGASGSDNAGNYSGGWSTGSNGGTGFAAWTLQNSSPTGGSYIGDASATGSNLSATNTSGNAFSLWADGPGFSKATRAFSSPMVANDRFTISIGHSWDNGNRGLNLFNGTSEIFNFNISGGVS